MDGCSYSYMIICVHARPCVCMHVCIVWLFSCILSVRVCMAACRSRVGYACAGVHHKLKGSASLA